MSWKKSSEPSIEYNCIAWALGFNHIWMWPSENYAWPRPTPSIVTIQEFIEIFALFGYEQCNTEIYESGYDKIALYVTFDEQPQHAARQRGTDGIWESKLGSGIDITHDFCGHLPDKPPHGPCSSYGGAKYFFKRRRGIKYPNYEEVEMAWDRGE
jgi:hypothetical protein